MSNYLNAAMRLNPALRIAVKGADLYENIIWGNFTPIDQATLDAEIVAMLAEGALETARKARKVEVKAEGWSRIGAFLPEAQTLEEIATIYRMIVPAARSAAADGAKAVYDAAVAALAYLNDPARTQAELDAYDAATDPAWP